MVHANINNTQRPVHLGDVIEAFLGPDARFEASWGANGSQSKAGGSRSKSTPSAAGVSWEPNVDVYDSKDLEVLSYLPGVDKSNINIDFDNTTAVLSISGERKRPVSEDDAQNVRALYLESPAGKFERRLNLHSLTAPDQQFNAEGIKASFENGLLRVLVPKKERDSARRIEIA